MNETKSKALKLANDNKLADKNETARKIENMFKGSPSLLVVDQSSVNKYTALQS